MPWWDALTPEEISERKFSQSEAREMLLYYEKFADEGLQGGKLTQEEAWDIYFALLHACDEHGFLNDRIRILGKIDTKKYNPFKSKSVEVLMIARIRASKKQSYLN